MLPPPLPPTAPSYRFHRTLQSVSKQLTVELKSAKIRRLKESTHLQLKLLKVTVVVVPANTVQNVRLYAHPNRGAVVLLIKRSSILIREAEPRQSIEDVCAG